MSSTCSACQLTISDANETVKCNGSCGNTFHISCTSLNCLANDGYLSKDTWLCPSCYVGPSSVHSIFDDSIVTRGILDEIIQEVKLSMMEKVGTSAKYITRVRSSMVVLSRYIDQMKQTLSELEEQVDRLQNESCRLNTRNSNIWRCILRIEGKIIDLEEARYSKDNGDSSHRKNMSYIRQNLPYVIPFAAYAVLAGIFFMIVTKLIQRDLKKPIDGFNEDD